MAGFEHFTGKPKGSTEPQMTGAKTITGWGLTLMFVATWILFSVAVGEFLFYLPHFIPGIDKAVWFNHYSHWGDRYFVGMLTGIFLAVVLFWVLFINRVLNTHHTPFD